MTTAETLSYADTTLSLVAVGADKALLVHDGDNDAEDEGGEERESVWLVGVSMMRGESEGSGFTVQVPSVSGISSTKETCFELRTGFGEAIFRRSRFNLKPSRRCRRESPLP